MINAAPAPPVAPPLWAAPADADGPLLASEADVSFHRLARIRPRYRWWRPLLTGVVGTALYGATLLFVGVVGAMYALAANPGWINDPSAGVAPDVWGVFDLDRPWMLAVLLVPLILMIPMLAAASRMIQGRGVGFLLSVTGRLRWRWFGRTLLIAFAVFSVSILINIGVSALIGTPMQPTADHSGIPLMLLLVILLVPLQAAAEEYVFRGYLMQLVGSWLKHPAFAILLPVPLFVLGHGYDLWGQLSIAVFAVVAGWLCWRTGGLEAAIAMHVANNVLLFVFASFGLADANATSGTPIDLLLHAATMLVFTAIVVRSSRGIERYAASASASRIV